MFAASMKYTFYQDHFEQGVEIWKEEVLHSIRNQEGFVRVELFTNPPEALVIAVWKEKEFAEKYMQTGVFKKLMKRLETVLETAPEGKQWALPVFQSADRK
ncbi:MAG: antibiotic biosynthesis monooxygenase [Spirochaetia bacterium]